MDILKEVTDARKAYEEMKAERAAGKKLVLTFEGCYNAFVIPEWHIDMLFLEQERMIIACEKKLRERH